MSRRHVMLGVLLRLDQDGDVESFICESVVLVLSLRQRCVVAKQTLHLEKGDSRLTFANPK